MPQLYITGQQRQNFNTKVFWGWTLNSIFHSLVLYWLPLQGTGCLLACMQTALVPCLHDHFPSQSPYLYPLSPCLHPLASSQRHRLTLPCLAFKYGVIHGDGTVTGQWVFGHVVYSVVVYTVILKVYQQLFLFATGVVAPSPCSASKAHVSYQHM